jgi:4-hydroxy-3-methylbut-2-enyl diphosphate reductase
MGVRRAVDIAAAAVKEAAESGFRVYTLGPLIHNPQVLENLKAQGVEIIDEGAPPPDLHGSKVIIRAHGIPPSIEAELSRLGAKVVDATCPRVKASQMKAKVFSEKGCCVFLAGEVNHGEVAGIQGYAPECVIAGNAREAEWAAAELFKKDPLRRTALIGQTTITPEEYEAIAGGIKKHFPHVEVIDSICWAVRDRQESLRELCALVEGVIIAGGRKSANTRRLLDTALGLGKKAWLAETPGDIPPEAAACKTMGLAAGASTPDGIIDAIEAELLSL